MSEEIDLLEDAKPAATEDTLKKIYEKADDMLALKERIEKGEEYLKEYKAQYVELEQKELPELMDEANMTSFETKIGLFKLKPFLKASLPSQGAIDKAKGEEKEKLKSRLERGLKWLRENEAADIIKQMVHADVGKDDDIAKQVMEALEDLGVPIKRDQTVHAGTLASLIKEKIENKTEVDFDLFGVFSGRQVKVTKAKK